MPRRLPPLNALRAFEAAARHQSFSKAAQELHVTDAAISHQVKALEGHLGRPLFRRRHRQVELTDAGRAYFSPLQDAFDVMARATERIFEAGNENILTISSAPSFAIKWLMPRLGRFWEKCPHIELHLFHSSRLTDFAHEDVDIAIRYGDGNWPGLALDFLMGAEMTPICSRLLLEHGPAIKKPDDLRHHVLLHEDTYDNWPVWFRKAGVAGMAGPREGVRGPLLDDSWMLLQAAATGRGVALGRPSLIREELAAGDFVRLFEAVIEEDKGYYAVMPPHHGDRPQVAAFTAWLKGEIETYLEIPI